jgi:hypothetical protein
MQPSARFRSNRRVYGLTCYFARHLDVHKHTTHLQSCEVLMRHDATSLDIHIQALLPGVYSYSDRD